MITARDVMKQVKAVRPEVDNFIEDELVPRFVKSAGQPITVGTSVVDEFVNMHQMSRREFQNQLEIRGFVVKAECKCCPFGFCKIVISIPPQEE